MKHKPTRIEKDMSHANIIKHAAFPLEEWQLKKKLKNHKEFNENGYEPL
jgi:hypothetical protein